MASENVWYGRQAAISKMLIYAAILILLASVAWAVYVSRPPAGTLAEGMTWAIAGTAIAAFLVGMSAIIDLMIVQAEALHDLRNK